MKKLIFIIVSIVFIAGGGIAIYYFFGDKLFPSKETTGINGVPSIADLLGSGDENIDVSTSENTGENDDILSPENEQPSGTTNPFVCETLGENIKTCTVYECTYAVSAGSEYTISIKGSDNDGLCKIDISNNFEANSTYSCTYQSEDLGMLSDYMVGLVKDPLNIRDFPLDKSTYICENITSSPSQNTQQSSIPATPKPVEESPHSEQTPSQNIDIEPTEPQTPQQLLEEVNTLLIRAKIKGDKKNAEKLSTLKKKIILLDTMMNKSDGSDADITRISKLLDSIEKGLQGSQL